MNTHRTPPSSPLYRAPTNDEQHARGERALWRAVITQALMDAASNSRKAEARYHKHEALHWLSGRSEDFATVCQNAGLEPDYVRRMARRALASGCKWRAEAGAGLHPPRKRRMAREREYALFHLPSPRLAFVQHSVALQLAQCA